MARSSGRLLDAILLFALALAVRCWRWPLIFTPDGVRFFGNDAYYHARRVLYALAHYPEILRRDAYVAFPDGGEPIWPPLFDGLLATFARPFVAPGNSAALETLLVWVPPLIGAGCVLALYDLARRAFGLCAARAAALGLALLPAHAHYSQLGFVDHHAAVALVSVWMASCTWRVCDRPGDGPRGPIVLGCVLALALAIWPGALMHVVLAQTALWLGCVFDDDAARARLRARDALWVQLAAALAIAPLALGHRWEIWGAWSPLVLSNFQPLFFAVAAAAFASALVGAQTRLARASRVGVATLALASLFLWLPGVSRGLLDSWAWLARAEAFQAAVAESSPLLVADDGSMALGRAASSLSLAFFAVPLLALGLWRGWRMNPAARLVALGWLAAMFVAALAQRRFVNALAPPLMLAFGWAVAECHSRLREGGLRRAMTVAAAAFLLFLGPAFVVQAKRAAEFAPWMAGAGYTPRAAHARQHVLIRIGHWLRAHTAPTAGYLDAGEAPAYGLLGAWGDGHALRYSAQRPVVTDNFGDDVGRRGMAAADAYFSTADEATANEILEALRVRYVVVRASGSGTRPRFEAGSMLERLYWLDAGRVPGQPGRRVAPALQQHRLVHASRERIDGEISRPLYRVYEVVSAARLEGVAPAGAEVAAAIMVREPGGFAFEYVTHTRADAAGHYSLRLPYASGTGTAGAADSAEELRTSDYYELRSGGRSVRLRVPEAAVVGGTKLTAPAL